MTKMVALAFDLSKPDHIGEYFRVLMSRKKVGLDEVAAGVQASKSLVSSAMNGKKQSRRVIQALAEYFGEDPAIFFAESEGRHQTQTPTPYPSGKIRRESKNLKASNNA